MSKRLVHRTGVAGRWLAAAVALVVALLATAAPAAASAVGHISFSPSAGPVGSVITLTGHLSRSERNLVGKDSGVTAYITAGHPHAGLETMLPGHLSIDRNGDMRLTVSVPLHAEWRANPMTGSTDRLSATPAPTVLELAWPCRACGLGTFEVTSASSLPFTGSADRQLLALAALLLGTGGAALAVGLRSRTAVARSIE